MCDYSLLNVRSRPAKVGDKHEISVPARAGSLGPKTGQWRSVFCRGPSLHFLAW